MTLLHGSRVRFDRFRIPGSDDQLSGATNGYLGAWFARDDDRCVATQYAGKDGFVAEVADPDPAVVHHMKVRDLARMHEEAMFSPDAAAYYASVRKSLLSSGKSWIAIVEKDGASHQMICLDPATLGPLRWRAMRDAPAPGCSARELADWLDAEGPDAGDLRGALFDPEFRPAEAGDLLVHFSHDPEALRGPLLGTRDLQAVTFGREKGGSGWNFAYHAESGDAWDATRPQDVTDYDVDEEQVLGDGYGDHALVFRGVDHVLVRHEGDGDRQAIFRGEDVDFDRVVRLERDFPDDAPWDEMLDEPQWHLLGEGGERLPGGPMTWPEAAAAARAALDDRDARYASGPDGP